MDRHRKPPNPYDHLDQLAAVHLTLAGFARSSPAAVQATLDTIDRLPAAHLTDLRYIVYDPHHQSFDNPAVNASTKGLYLREGRDIVIFDFDDLDELRHILCHEIGHHVFEQIIDGDTRVDWTTDTHPRGGHITAYSERSAAEDFAECYAAFSLRPKQLETLTRKYQFLRDRVFYGIAINLTEAHIDYSI